MSDSPRLHPVTRRILERMDELGLKPNGVSLEAGLSRDYIRSLKRRDMAQPKHENLAELARVLNCSLAYLRLETDDPEEWAVTSEQYPAEQANNLSSNKSFDSTQKSRQALRPEVIKPRLSRGDKLPVKGYLKAGSDGHFFQDAAVDFITCPPELEGVEGAYAMQVIDDCLMPLIQPGYYVTFNPHKPPRVGELVAIYLTDGQMLLKLLKKMTPSEVQVTQTNPVETFRFKRDKVEAIHRFATLHSERP